MAYTTTSGFPNLAVRIPKPGAEAARLKEGDALEIEVVEGRVELRRASKVPTLATLVSQITSENCYTEFRRALKWARKLLMVTPYVPQAGDIVMLDFDLQVGREQAKLRPVLVLTDQRYNRGSCLAVVCPLTSKRKPYPFALPLRSTNLRVRCWWNSSKDSTGWGVAPDFIPRRSRRLSAGCVNI